jgi:apolipoprotein N-acyltransferase
MSESRPPSPYKILAAVVGLLLLSTVAVAVSLLLAAWVVPEQASIQERKGWIAIAMVPLLPVGWLWARFFARFRTTSKEKSDERPGI